MKKHLFIKNSHSFNKGGAGGFIDEKGMVLAIALVIMTILALVGASALLTTNTEVKIAANDRIYRSGFYSADAGIEWARRNVNSSTSQNNGATLCTNLGSSELCKFVVKNYKGALVADQIFYYVESTGWDPTGTREISKVRAIIEAPPPGGPVYEGGYSMSY
ncbi:MAG: pilus assembly PilX N-terminal domain-containing protein [Thermodesulfobacteriota bacterium]|nr:pilus assembly PilX N-terminal domain-containing protein [Thermodesulfobacteriota bacterium]